MAAAKIHYFHMVVYNIYGWWPVRIAQKTEAAV